MSRIGILVFAWLICWRCCVATEEAGQAQEAQCNERPFATFLQNAPSLKQEELWTAVKASQLILDSSAGHDFYFESVLYAPGKRLKRHRLLCDSQVSHVGFCVLEKNNLPEWLEIDAEMVWVKPDLAWGYADKQTWGVVYDQDHLQFDNQADRPEGVKQMIKFDFQACFTELGGEKFEFSSWDKVSRTASFHDSEGMHIRLGFRTPNDAERFGLELSEASFLSSDKAFGTFRCFQTKPNGRTRLKLVDRRSWKERLGLADDLPKETRFDLRGFDSPESKLRAEALEADIRS